MILVKIALNQELRLIKLQQLLELRQRGKTMDDMKIRISDIANIIRINYTKGDAETTLPIHIFNATAFYFFYDTELVFIVIKDNCVWAYRDSDSEPRFIFNVNSTKGNVKISDIIYGI